MQRIPQFQKLLFSSVDGHGGLEIFGTAAASLETLMMQSSSRMQLKEQNFFQILDTR